MTAGRFCVLVNSSDHSRDIFEIVFRNAEKMWRDCDWPRFAGFTSMQPDIYGFKSVAARGPSDWRGELGAQLDSLPPEIEYVLRLEEDALFLSPVNGKKLEEIADIMLRENLCYVSLVPVSRSIAGRAIEFFRRKLSTRPLRLISFSEPYYSSLVPAIWKRGYLRELLRRPGSVWDFELTVTRERHYAVWEQALDAAYIVTKGRWRRSAPQLLAREGLSLSGSKREMLPLRSRLRQARENLSFRLFGYMGFRIRRRLKRLGGVPKDLACDQFSVAPGRRLAPVTAASEFYPVFVHASMRSGSTYFFNVLRRNESLVCFNESISAKRGQFRERSKRDLEAQKRDMNHQFLDRNDFAEFVEARDAAMHLCPEFPEFHEYLPPEGALSAELLAYLSALMNYAASRNKRPVMCEIYSRGRAGALRGAFGGFHVAQYRDPLSQFGSFVHLVVEQGWWGFLAFPLRELGISGSHPLYEIIPEALRLPVLPWPPGHRARRWATDVQYTAIAASPSPEGIGNVFCWHMFSWLLGNLAALSYSDMALDIDKVHDDPEYRASISDALKRGIGGGSLDFSDIKKFDRYYEFESFDAASVCDQVASAVRSALKDGRLDAALRSLGTQPLVTSAAAAVEILLNKIHESLAAMARSAERRHFTAGEWRATAEKHQKMWFNPFIRWFAAHTYPVAEPAVRAARWAGLPL